MKLPSGYDTPVKIGSGLSGTVYRVRQKHLDRNVILKIISLSKDKERDNHFKEATTLAHLHLPHTPQIYDVFMWKNSLCIVMQWIRSLNLTAFNALSVEKTLRIVIANELFQAVASLHSQGYAHRDLKPENILISPSEGLFLIDFGFTTKTSGNKQSTNKLVGTPEYMAPELFEIHHDVVDLFRADCYSLGVILESILGQDNGIPIVNLLKSHDPQVRPENASCAYQLWLEQVGKIPHYEYSSFLDQKVKFAFCETLLQNVKQLMQQQKNNEAYRLCLECLQETPDHPDAIKVLSSFSSNTKSKYYHLRMAFISIVILVALSFAFFVHLSKKIEQNNSVLLTSVFTENQGVVDTFSQVIEQENIKFRYTKLETPSLTSEIIFQNNKINGSIFINGKLAGKLLANQSIVNCRLPAGNYRYSVVNDKNELLRSEQIVILPFSKVNIRLKDRLE